MKLVVLYINIFLLHLIVAETFLRTSNNDTYYIQAEYQYNWFQAYLECSYRNMSLLTIESEEKFRDLYQHLTSEVFPPEKRPPDLWIGGIGYDHKFLWISNGNPVIFSLWAQGNPSNSNNNEFCLHIHYLNPKTVNCINDIDCNRKMGFICEPKKIQSNESCNNQNEHGKYKSFIFNFNQNR